MEFFRPGSPGGEGGVFFLRKAGIVIEGVTAKERREEAKNVTVGGLGAAFDAADFLNPVDDVIIIAAIEFREVGGFQSGGLRGR